ncbi:50S ribosomal protein L3 N(5)-glutamine methyltransferase [Thiohalobacter thiocyanaticus]|uniref:Ribosomal protein uL3 glutamine methyltransferase n=1 Tax=Thiohalobacter thiocyanaticus TaxID=585455 RepID=A0A426QGK4_9GAMM|nr:50S ribosomal protein L3 N(5)-glutamine methyltransferase [Thiohalobacter thiocyanaticus]RRQ20860.1 50S ribosomal protein L3 N(5)-glutamine methyltransferase [Thiohalobacter thiocyanaticus]
MENAESIITTLTRVRDYIRWAASRFAEHELCFGHGTDNALDEAAYLVLNVLRLPPDLPPEYLDAVLAEDERRRVLELLRKRYLERIPVPYLVEEAWFAGLSFHVDERVLIPRSPIAELIETGFEPWIPAESVGRVLDLCTGSGCIAIASAFYLEQVQVDAADLSSEALEVARINVGRHHLQDRVRVIQSDLFSALEGEVYDVIVSNPPYVDAEEMAGLPLEYRHEPPLGLSGGETGLDLVFRILSGARRHLAEQGILIVEVGNSEPALIEALPQVPFTWLEFERGGQGVFLLDAAQLEAHQADFDALVS